MTPGITSQVRGELRPRVPSHRRHLHELLQTLGCWGEKVACGHKTIGTLRTTYLVNGDGVIERIMGPKEIKTKIHAEQILEII